jgi:hypothetical protein
MKTNDPHQQGGSDGRPVNEVGPEANQAGRARVAEHDPVNAWGERVVAGEGEYPGPEALRNEAPDDTATHGQKLEDMSDEEARELNSAHGGLEHNGTWPNPER